MVTEKKEDIEDEETETSRPMRGNADIEGDEVLDDDQVVAERLEALAKLQEKNHQIENLLDELRHLEVTNQQLSSSVKKLQTELEDATRQLAFSTEEIAKLQKHLGETQEFNKGLLKEKEYFLKEIDELRAKVSILESEDEDVGAKFTEQVDALIALLNDKDAEIKALRSRLEARRVSFTSDRQKSELLAVKEDEIQLLKSQLREATKEMDEQSKLVERLQNELSGEKINKTLEEKERECDQLKADFQSATSQIERLEEELSSKDKELDDVKKRNSMYEKDCYGLSEAIQEIKQHQRTIGQQNKKIEELVRQLNELKLEQNDVQDELDYVRECARLKDIDPTFDPKSARTPNDRIKILKLQQQVVQLEEEKIAAQTELRTVRAGLLRTPMSEDDKAFQKRIHELENENAELQLGMKEILIGLKETDSRTDVVIECPSLERVCQLLESRSVSAQHTNVISLKAELDLQRGHNEQLRADLKRLRCEHVRLIAAYTEDVMGDGTQNSTRSDDNSRSEGELIRMMSKGEIIPLRTHKQREKMGQDKEDNGGDKDDSKRDRPDDNGSAGNATGGDQTESNNGQNDESGIEENREGDQDKSDKTEEDNDGRKQTGAQEHPGESDDDDSDQGHQGQTKPVPLKRQQRTKEFEERDQSVDDQVPNEGATAVDTLDEISTASNISTVRPHQAVSLQDAICQTDEPSGPQSPPPRPTTPQPPVECPNCLRVTQAFEEVQTRLGRLEHSVTSSDEVYAQQIRHLQRENEQLRQQFTKQLEDKDALIADKEAHIRTLSEQQRATRELIKDQTSKADLRPKFQRRDTFVLDSPDINETMQLSNQPQSSTIGQTSTHLVPASSSPTPSKSHAVMLKQIIECLQARINHKDDSIKEYQRLLEQTKEKFERDMRNLLHETSAAQQQPPDDRHSKPIDFQQLIDNEELQSALEKCVAELEKCRREARAEIDRLELELSKEQEHCEQLARENDRLKVRTSQSQFEKQRRELEKVREELADKERTVERLNKSLRDERAIRISSGVKATSPRRSDKREQDLINEVASLKEQIETKNKLIKELEVSKWDFDKRIHETIELYQEKIKERVAEIVRLEKLVQKQKQVLDKSEKERHSLDTKLKKVSKSSIGNGGKSTGDKDGKKRTASGGTHKKSATAKATSKTVTYWAQDVPSGHDGSKNQLPESERVNCQRKVERLERELRACKETEEELRILLRESVQREKLATIREASSEQDVGGSGDSDGPSPGHDGQKSSLPDLETKLLQENAHLKVELRMAEFELKRLMTKS